MQWEDRIGRRIRFRDLHIALAVAQSGSMLKAAEELAVSQPVISKVIADLEHRLGVQLFNRSRKGVEPTASGRALLNRGRAAFDELKQGVKEIEFLNDPAVGELQIGASTTLAEGLVLPAIERFSRQYPRVIFHIVQGGALALHAELRERRIELGFVRMSGPLADHDMEQEALFEEPLVIVAGKDHPCARPRNISLSKLVNERWTWPPPGTFTNELVVEAFRSQAVEPPRATVYAEPINMRIRLAATGRFLAVVPAYILRLPVTHEPLKVLPVELPTTRRQIGMITLKKRTLSPLTQLFIKCVREVAKPLVKRK